MKFLILLAFVSAAIAQGSNQSNPPATPPSNQSNPPGSNQSPQPVQAALHFGPGPVVLPCPPGIAIPYAPVCAGLVSGCGLLKNFDNICYIVSYNRANPQTLYEVKYKGLCYPPPNSKLPQPATSS